MILCDYIRRCYISDMNFKVMFICALGLFSSIVHAQTDTLVRPTGFSLACGGTINFFDVEPKVVLLNHLSVEAGFYQENGNLHFAYNRGEVGSHSSNGVGMGFEIYLKSGKVSADAVLAIKEKGISGLTTGTLTLGAAIIDDNLKVVGVEAAYWQRIKRSRFYFGAMPAYQYGNEYYSQSGWLVSEKIEDNTVSYSLALSCGVQAEHYTRVGFFINGSLLAGVCGGKWESEYIRKDNSVIVERRNSSGFYDPGLLMTFKIKVGWVF